MSNTRLWKWLTGLRAFGPYILIELLLPGGTLLALLLWLSQRFNRAGFGGVHRSSVEADKDGIAAAPDAAPASAANG